MLRPPGFPDPLQSTELTDTLTLSRKRCQHALENFSPAIVYEDPTLSYVLYPLQERCLKLY